MKRIALSITLLLVVAAVPLRAQTRVHCRDGSTAAAASGCAHHGGVAARTTHATRTTTRRNGHVTHTRTRTTHVATAPGAPGVTVTHTRVTHTSRGRAFARCRDGYVAHGSRRGACSGHGGVLRWL